MSKKKGKGAAGPPGAPAWMATYSDLVTLLFCFFVLLYAMSKPDVQKLIQIAASFGQQTSIIDWEVGDNIMENISNGIMDMPPIIEEGKRDKEDDNEDQSGQEREQNPYPVMGDDFPTYWAENAALRDVLVEATEHSIRFSLGDMLFDSGSDVIRPEAMDILRLIAGEFDQFPDYEVFIEGHTDNVPISTTRFPSNWALSSGRAESVGQFYIDEGYIAPDRITAVGYGENRPVATNDTPEGRQQNRRVEIRLVRGVNAPAEISREQ